MSCKSHALSLAIEALHAFVQSVGHCGALLTACDSPAMDLKKCMQLLTGHIAAQMTARACQGILALTPLKMESLPASKVFNIPASHTLDMSTAVSGSMINCAVTGLKVCTSRSMLAQSAEVSLHIKLCTI